MKNLFVLVLFFSTIFAYGQSKQNFESETFPPQDWTVYHLLGEDNNKNGWTRTSQTGLSFTDIENHVAYSLNGRSKKNADSWLITPKTTIKAGDHLNFMLKFKRAGESTKDTLDLLISETGIEKGDFVSRLLRITPKVETAWTQYSLDLSAYVGKSIYVAFHDHLMNPVNYVSGCDIFLDDVEIANKSFSDLSVSSIITPRNDCSTLQYVELDVTNSGKTINECTLCYQINEEEIVKETITDTFILGTQKVTLKTPAAFQENSNNKFKVWIECNEDLNLINDTLSTNVSIGKQITYPYNIMQSSEPKADFTSYGGLSGKWKYTKTNILENETFVYVGNTGAAVLGSNCIDLPLGKVKVSFKYVTTQHALMKVFTTTERGLGKYVNQIGESPLLFGNAKLGFISFVIDVPKAGLQSLGFSVYAPEGSEFVDTSNGSGGVQFVMTDLVIEPVCEDLAVKEIASPDGIALTLSDKELEIKVRVENQGLTDQSGFAIHYQLNENAIVSEAYTQILKSGEEADYLFTAKAKFTRKGQNFLKVWTTSETDKHLANDTIKQTIYVYEAYTMPYKMSFEETEDMNCWTFANAGKDMIEWKIQNVELKGSKAIYLSYIQNLPNDDYLISPAIRLPKGNARIAFFYALSNTGTMKMEVLMGKDKNNLDKILFEQSTPTDGIESGYALFNIEEPGDYYFAIHGQGLAGELLLDDIRIDTDMDACMKDISFVEKENYNLTQSAVKIVFSNNSAKNVNSPKVAYQLNGNVEVVETIDKIINAGEIVEYTFKQLADLSICTTYSLRGRVEIDGDVEELNNAISVKHEHYENKQLPYYQNFEDLETRECWLKTVKDLNENDNSWIAAGNLTFMAYSGTSCLYHDSNYEGNDWIFSECIEIPVGEFELSFFYRTFKNWADRKENFKVMLGTAPTPEAMTLEMAKYEQISVSGSEYMKAIQHFKTTESGFYYIGIYTDSPMSKGAIYIDDILLKAYEERAPFYQSDFMNHFDEWTIYQPSTASYDQWIQTTEEGKDYDIVQLKTFRVNAPGMLASPGFKIDKGEKIKLEMEYALVTTNEKDRLGLYMGDENHPDSISTLVAELSPTDNWSVYEKEISVEKDGRYFFAVKAQRAAKEKDVLYKLGSFRLTPAGLNSYELKGKITDGTGKILSGVLVYLKGGQKQNTVTDENGVFTFEKVVELQTYELEIVKDNFVSDIIPIELDGEAKDLGTIILDYELLSPIAVTALVEDNDERVTVDWMTPGSILEYRYDDGVIFGQVGFGSGTASDIMGTVFRSKTQVNEVSWFTTPANGAHGKVNLYILDLNEEGEPTNSILYSITDVPNEDLDWNSHSLPEPINAPNGFMVAISYNKGSLDLAIDDGVEDYPFASRTCYIGSLVDGTFSTFESKGGKSNFFLRAKGTPLNSINKSSTSDDEALVLFYNVYRFEDGDKGDETKWTLLTSKPLHATNFTDDISKLYGDYMYAVKSVYPTNEMSQAAFSNIIQATLGSEITDGAELNQLRLSPLPARDYLKVNSATVINSYTLYDMTGKTVDRKEVGNNEFSISVGHFSTGVYILHLYTDKDKTIHNIMIR